MRDLRLDFFRGLAICMILVDHMPGNPLAKFTYQAIGFSDAAEIFVFISGITCGIVYSRALARRGLSGLRSSIARRTFRIYRFYALSSAGAILLVATAAKYLPLQDVTGITPDRPGEGIVLALLLIAPPSFADVLVVYIILTCLVLPPLILVHSRYRIAALGASGCIWLASQFLTGYTAYLTTKLSFNPFAWQFLFAIGVTIGAMHERSPSALRALLQRRWLKIMAWAIALGAVAIKVLASRSFFNVPVLRLDPHLALHMKENLSALRLTHFLGIAYLAATYFSRNAPFLTWSLASPIINMGRHSLELYSLSIVVAVGLNIVVLAHAPSFSEWIAIDSFAFALLALAAASLAHRRATVQ